MKAVVPYYEEFLKRFPSLQALAEEPEQEVLAAWSGLPATTSSTTAWR